MTQTWHPLDDQPLRAEQCAALDAGRLQPAIDSLTAYFRSWLRFGGDEPSIKPICLGLFGGLGQGKSTAVAAALHAARPRYMGLGLLMRRAFFGEPHSVFNVSQFTADDLEWRLMATVLLRRAFRNVVVMGLLLLVAMAVAQFWAGRLHNFNLLSAIGGAVADLGRVLVPDAISGWWTARAVDRTFGSLAAWTLLTAIVGFVVGRLVTQPFHQRVRDGLVMRLARLAGAVPKVLIVDDLDRADVRQQRAFLRALHRWSQTDSLGWGVVVCMDDTALLQSPPAPESPEALILKCLQMVLRLPDRQREDVVTLALSSCQLALYENSDRKPLLSHVHWVASLVRVLLAANKPSAIGPRLVKHVLNDVMIQGDSVMAGRWPLDTSRSFDAADLDDWCALLRLDALLRLVPELRHDMPAVMKALEVNTESEFSKLFDVRRFDLQDKRRVDGLEYLISTRMLQPGHREGWFGLLVGGRREADDALSSKSSNARTDSAGALDPTVSPSLYRYTQLYCALIDFGRLGHLRAVDWHPRVRAPAQRDAGLRLEFSHAGFIADVAVSAKGTRYTRGALPSAWVSPDQRLLGTPALLHAWLCWVAVIAATDRPARETVLRQLPIWLAGEVEWPQQKLLQRNVLVERTSHVEHWQILAREEQLRMLDQVADDDNRALHLVAFKKEQLHMAAHALAKAGAINQRRAVALLGPTGDLKSLRAFIDAQALALKAANPQLPQFPAASDLGLVWPAPVRAGAPATDWVEVLRSPVLPETLRILGWDNRVPQTWLLGWQLAASEHLTTDDCLRLLGRVSRNDDTDSSRNDWNTARLQSWLQPAISSVGLASFPRRLKAIHRHDRYELQWSCALGDDETDAALVGLLVCTQLRWIPEASLLERALDRATERQMMGALWAILSILVQDAAATGTLRSAHKEWPEEEEWLLLCLRHTKGASAPGEDVLVAQELDRCLGDGHGARLLRVAGWPVADIPVDRLAE